MYTFRTKSVSSVIHQTEIIVSEGQRVNQSFDFKSQNSYIYVDVINKSA